MATLEKSRKELAGEYEKVQKKAFTNWVNSHLINAGQKVNDLYEDLKDGSKLLLLLELLTDTKLPRERGKMRVHKLQNVQNALNFLQKERRIKLVNIRNDEVVDGNPKLILGLIWTLILHFQISGGLGFSDPGERPTSPQEISTKLIKEQLLEWAQKATEGYEEVKVTNFHTSWRDGMAFCAILDRHRPDLFSYDDCDPEKPLENLERAFSVAEKELGIFRIVDPEDVYVDKPDDKAVMTYVSFLHHAFPDMPPPHHKKAPTVSLDDYKELHATTKKWIDDTSRIAKDRAFPNSIDQLKTRLAELARIKSKEMPMKQRDVKTLSDLFDKLQAQKKKPVIPPELEFSPLAEAWSELKKELADCEEAMQNHLDRLEHMQTLADKLLVQCDCHDASVDRLEEKMADFEQRCTSMAPQEAAALAADIRTEIEALETVVCELPAQVEQLRDGGYHNTDAVQQRVDEVGQRVAALSPRLEVASSTVSEAQAVVAMETSLEELEEWLVSCGKFSNNQLILVQIEEHKVFQFDQLAVAEQRISELNRSSPPPGLEDKVTEVNQRWKQVVKQTKDRIAGLEPIVKTVRAFEASKNPLEDWCAQQCELFASLPPLEVTEESLEEELGRMGKVEEDVRAHRPAVETVNELAVTFIKDTEPVQSLADRYARRLKSRDTVSRASRSRSSTAEPEASLGEQSSILENQWAWLKSQAGERSSLVADLLDKLRQFNQQHGDLRAFVTSGQELLATEHPVGNSAARIEEQMETCQDFRAKITARQPDVDAMLALGRAILAEPSTSSQNDTLMQKLTDFIQDWSDLQMEWQNWYNELHANMEKSQNLSDTFDAFCSSVGKLEPGFNKFFPATVSMEALDTQLQDLQSRYTTEVVQPYQEVKASYQPLKTGAALLPDTQAASTAFEKFEALSNSIESFQQELSGVAGDVCAWWGGCEGVRQWVEEAVSVLAEERPLASSVDLVDAQNRRLERLSEEIGSHGPEVEKALKALSELCGHDKLLETGPVEQYRQELKQQWDSLCHEAGERRELCASGREHLSSYAEQTLPLSAWLSGAEEKLLSLGAFPRSKERLFEKKEELEGFLQDVESHGDDLDNLEKKSSEFLSCAKAYQSQLLAHRRAVRPGGEGEGLPEGFVDPGSCDVGGGASSEHPPLFRGEDYENGISVVTGNSAALRKRYDSLHAGVKQKEQLLNRAVARRNQFDDSLAGFVDPLSKLEARLAGSDSEEEARNLKDKMEGLQVLEEQCLALEPKLQELNSSYELLADVSHSAEESGAWEGGEGGEGGDEDDALREKQEAEKRYKDLLDALHEEKEQVHSEITNAQAFHDAFESFATWLRETERKMQRDDPLRLEEAELKAGLANLQGISDDITAHHGVYEAVCGKCSELVESGAEDSDELKLKLENLQQRWNAIQIVSDDIEAIEETIPKLEAFHSTYNTISSDLDGLLDQINGFSVSAITSDGLEAKDQALKSLLDEVARNKEEFDSLLASCDLLETPFDQSQFEADISALQGKLEQCGEAGSAKKTELKDLKEQVLPMEDLFAKFRAWLADCGSHLTSLSPPSDEEELRTEQLERANSLIQDVDNHKEDLESLAAMVHAVLELVDEDDCKALGSQLREVTSDYDELRFDCSCYPSERWLEAHTSQLCSLAPCGVVVAPLQKQLHEVQEFEKSFDSYQPQLEALSALAKQAEQSSSSANSESGAKMAALLQRYDQLKVLSCERQEVLEAFMPVVQQFHSSRSTWGDLLGSWEDTAAHLPVPSGTPEAVQQQIEQVKSLQQSISDHEPEFTSLRRESQKLCEGPSQEKPLFQHLAEFQDKTASGQDATRPGQQELKETLDDYERRLEALKQTFSEFSSVLAGQFGKAREFADGVSALLDWLAGTDAEVEGLKIRDPKSSAIELQLQKCNGLLEDLASKTADKENLAKLFSDLISDLPDDIPEKQSLQNSLDKLNTSWSNLSDQLARDQTSLDAALGLARSYEGAQEKLVPWVPETLDRLENLGAPPTEPEMVEQLKADIEDLKSAYNTLAPVFATSADVGQALSTCCEEGEPKAALDMEREGLADQWTRLGQLFTEVMLKLTDALAQTQEFQGIASGLDRWMSGMEDVLSQQKRVAARVKLIEPQIEGLRPTLADFIAYSSTVEQTRTLGEKLMGESDPDERAKIETRLESLTNQFDKLQQSAQSRMTLLEDALAKATTYEDQSNQFDKWVQGAEEKVASWENFAIASQPLKRQLSEVQEFNQDVQSHKPTLESVTSSEEALFETELSTIEICEQHIETSKQQSVQSSAERDVLPDWFERPGAPEAIEVGADLRNRFDKLEVSVGARTDQASQLLERVLSYEEDFERFSDWLNGERAKVEAFSSPAITLEELKMQITEVENMQEDFKNRQEKLEAVDTKGTELIAGCKDELSRESGRIKLSDLNDLWGGTLADLSSREEKLREGQALAEEYKGLHDGFDGWLCECEEKAGAPPLTSGDPLDIRRQLDDMRALLEDIGLHLSGLHETAAAGRTLEAYTDAEPGSLPDIGYTALEDRYNALKISMGDRFDELEATLGEVGNLRDQLNDLLQQLEKMRSTLNSHEPSRVLPDDVLEQLQKLATLEEAYTALQPTVAKARGDASAYTAPQDTPTTAAAATEGAEMQELLTSLEKSNGVTKELLDFWRNFLNASLETAKKFDNDHGDLSDWLREKEELLSNADTVRGVPEGVEEQILQVEALQAEVPAQQKALDELVALGHSMMDNCSTEDSVTLGDKLARAKTSFESLRRVLLGRKRILDDGHVQATDFVTAWSEAMACIAAKSDELKELEEVGADIDTVKTQLDEYKAFETSLAELKPQISAVLAQGKQLKDNCSSIDTPAISDQLDQLNTAWSQLYSDGFGRKHQLEDALLQLGQFHDALAELLTWLADSMNTLREAPPPGVKPESVELQLQELKTLESSVSSHEPSVTSLNTAGEKLIACVSTDNTAEIQHDLADLNSNWDALRSMVADRHKLLDAALPEAQAFQTDWRSEVDWLAETERQASAEWKPCGLPETCQADLYKHEAFQSSVNAQREPIESLKVKAESLKQYGTPEDCRMMDRWVGDVVKRYDDLQATLEEKQSLLEHAKKQADECEGLYHTLRDRLEQFDQLQASQEPIHSEVEAVKQQMEDQKDHLKNLSFLEGELDELDGLGQLLCRECVKPDGKVIQQRIEELRARLEGLRSAAEARQSSLEESLLSLGQFEEAYEELWAWLTDAVRQLEDADPITGDPDTVAAQLARHKALQKQLGSRNSSKNAVTKAGRVLMKHKTGEDKAVLKKKLQDLEREWEKVCLLSVEKQDRLEDAYKKIAQFRSHLGPLRSWMAKVLPLLDESEPVHGDISTVDALYSAHNAFQKELGAHQKGVGAANDSGEQLVSEVLDDPSVTQQDLAELNELWDSVCQQSVSKQERLDQAMVAAREFDDGFSELVLWIDATTAELGSQPPPNEDASILQEQIEEHKALSQEVTSRQPDLDRVLAAGESLLQLAHPRAVPILQTKLQQLHKKWLGLRGRAGARSEELASALLELHGLQDMLDNLWSWVSDAEDTMATTEATPIGNDLESVEEQLSGHEVFQEEMATHQPNMDALNKAAKKLKAAQTQANPEMTKKIGSLYKRWQKLWLRSSERHRQLLEARTRLRDIALARSFNFDAWRKRFKAWVDQQKLRVNDLFRRFDGNHDGMLTRAEFMKGLKASGLAMNQIEMEKIANAFDQDKDGLIDLNEIMAVLKGSRRAQPVSQAAASDSDKIDSEIQLQVSKCTCASKFKVTRVAEGKYKFGDVQKLRLVRILRSTVMVRVGGGWEALEEFLRKHDPCRASGRTNVELKRYLGSSVKPGLATAEFTSKRQTATAAKNAATKKAASKDPLATLTTRTLPSGRKETAIVKKLSPGHSREVTPTRDSTQKSPVRHGTPTRSPVRHAHDADGRSSRTPPRSDQHSRLTPPRQPPTERTTRAPHTGGATGSSAKPLPRRTTPMRPTTTSAIQPRTTPQKVTSSPKRSLLQQQQQQRGSTPPRANGTAKAGRGSEESGRVTPQSSASSSTRRSVTPEARAPAQAQAPAAGSTDQGSTPGRSTPTATTRPTTPGGGGVPRASRIPTPSKSKIPTRQS